MPTAGVPAVLEAPAVVPVALEAVAPSDKSYKLYYNVSTLPHHCRQGFLYLQRPSQIKMASGFFNRPDGREIKQNYK